MNPYLLNPYSLNPPGEILYPVYRPFGEKRKKEPVTSIPVQEMDAIGELFRDLGKCCLHDPQWMPSDVQRVICWHGDRAADDEASTILIVYLRDNAYGLLVQSSSFTGHGCGCDSMALREVTFHRLLAHLSDAELLALIA